jgi:hypothetical protein
MKNPILFTFVLFIFLVGESFSQTVEGKMSVSGFPRDGNIKEIVPVDLLISFKEGKYKINFSFKADNMGSRGIVLFDMYTTVKRNGKTVHSSSRKGWPWIPVPPRDVTGEVFVPIEAFDVIPALQKHVGEMPAPKLYDPKTGGALPLGKYEIILEMIPASTWVADMEREIVPKGKIAPATFSFNVTN